MAECNSIACLTNWHSDEKPVFCVPWIRITIRFIYPSEYATLVLFRPMVSLLFFYFFWYHCVYTVYMFFFSRDTQVQVHTMKRVEDFLTLKCRPCKYTCMHLKIIIIIFFCNRWEPWCSLHLVLDIGVTSFHSWRLLLWNCLYRICITLAVLL